MVVFLLVLLFGAGFAYFATQNTVPVTVRIASYTFDTVPLYLVILISIAASVLISAFIYLVKSLSSSLMIREHKGSLNDAKKQIAELTKIVHKLELENTRLKTEVGEKTDQDSI